MTIKEYLIAKEKKEFDESRIFRLYQNCVEERKSWDLMAEIGALIYTGRYMMGAKVGGDTSSQHDFYNINFVADNLKHSINKTLANEIDVVLVNDRNEILPQQDILELELNYIIDRIRVVRDIKQILIQNKFMGFGAGVVRWDEDLADSDWWTGKPVHMPIDPRNIWYVSPHNLETKKDINMIFHRERYTLNEFKLRYPEYYEQFQYGISSMQDDKRDRLYEYNMGIVSLVTCQYQKKFITKQRAVANEEPEGMSLEYFSEDEYREYLKDIGANENNIKALSKIGENPEESVVFPEYIRASKLLERTEKPWFQCVFIPEASLMLEHSVYVGQESNYVIMPGDWNPDSNYPIPKAYQYKELQKMAGILLTTMVLNTVKIQKPIPVVISGALKNEAHFLQNYHKIGVAAIVDPDWSHKNPGEHAVRWMLPPTPGQMQTMLFQLIEKSLDKSMSTPNVSRGMPDYSGQSGKQTALLQNMANVDSQPDYFAIEEYFRKVCDRMKDMIAEKRDYPHQLFLPNTVEIDGLTTDDGQRAIVNVNTDDTDKLVDVARHCYSRVIVEQNMEQKKQIKDAKYENLFTAGIIDFEEYIMNQSWADKPEKLLRSYERSGNDRAVAQYINANPQVKEAVLQMMQQTPSLEGEPGANIDTPTNNTTGANEDTPNGGSNE